MPKAPNAAVALYRFALREGDDELAAAIRRHLERVTAALPLSTGDVDGRLAAAPTDPAAEHALAALTVLLNLDEPG